MRCKLFAAEKTDIRIEGRLFAQRNTGYGAAGNRYAQWFGIALAVRQPEDAPLEAVLGLRYSSWWGGVVKQGIDIAAACPGQVPVSVQPVIEPDFRVRSPEASLLPGFAMVRQMLVLSRHESLCLSLSASSVMVLISEA